MRTAALRIAVFALATMAGAWMTFDGSRALLVGDYVTPTSGEYAGQLGPWAPLVEAAGIAPRSTGMKLTFVALGILWIAGAVGFSQRKHWSHGVLLVVSVATLWYLPIGTLVSLIVLGSLALLRAGAGAQEPERGALKS